ncbi:MAG: hypothetical protein HPY58_13495 [Firmicutes bacterium]|nr:hypothetical protein [Bacillota bacterium]
MSGVQDDLLAEAAERQRTGVDFSGVIYAHLLRVSIGGAVRDLGRVSGSPRRRLR